ncbi:MAG: UPF0104 family protein [Planctomycetota bacterium]|nr:MAG: UPF0104 family protein [Planctomycetota bacterium]REJ96950.1 MAG: UPF0104 family protein [Planctomycetota bacterium]REK26393.1 MAG: UPF0104 family protein [Planctomycetota bacterium]REK37942.1 MAG: UPF0104 family protein [Planctomycetota bacterium]
MSEPVQVGDLGDESGGSVWTRQRLRKVFALLVLIAIGIAAARSDIDMLEALERMRTSNVWMLAGMIGVFIATRWFNGEVLRQSLSVLGHHIEKSEAFYITIVRTYGGLVVPKGGYGAAGVYLKMKHGVDFAKSGSLLMPLMLLQFAAIGPLGVAALLLLRSQYGVPIDGWWATCFCLVTALGVSVFLLRTSVPAAWDGKVGNFLRRVGQAWQQIRGDGKLVARLLTLHVLLIFLRALRLQLALYAVVQDVPFLPVLVASLLADIVFFISPTPNGLGTREWIICFFFATLPLMDPVIDDTRVASAVGLDRIVTTLLVIIFAQIGLVRVAPPEEADNGAKPSRPSAADASSAQPTPAGQASDSTPAAR